MKGYIADRLGIWCFSIGCWFLMKCFSHIVFPNTDGIIHLVVFATDKFHIDQFALKWTEDNELAGNNNQAVQ